MGKYIPTKSTILVTLIAAFVGTWIGAIVAFNRNKREKGFERRVCWYTE